MIESAHGSTRPATIEDVAAGAHVSVATVSRAVRGLPNVAPSTRQRVCEVAAALNYRADPAAARLAAGRTRTVTVVVPHLAGWYFSTVIAGAEAVCADSGYDCLVITVGSTEDSDRVVDEAYHLERRTDGCILVNVPIDEARATSLSERGVAVSTVGARVAGHPNVTIDDAAAARMAVEHLVALGHRRIGMISGQGDDPMNFEVPRLRRRGFIDALAAAGLDFDETLVESGNFGIDGGREATAVLLDRPSPPTAVFAMSDEMAFGALMTLNDRGLTPGVDVSLVGIDDHDVSRVVGLTTVRQHVADQGATAARALLSELERRDDGTPVDAVVAPIELVVRSTTGAPTSAPESC